MAHSKPWYKRNGGDFVIAVMHFPDNDFRWTYSAIIDLLNDRDRPIPDDAHFICGVARVTKQKWTKIRAYLLQHGYLELTEDGCLTNPRFERERTERAGQREASVEAGREGGKRSAAARAERQSELALEENLPRNLQESDQLSSKKHTKFLQSLSEVSDEHSLKTNGKIEPPPQPTRARAAASEARDKISNNQPSDPNAPRARVGAPAPAHTREGAREGGGGAAAHPSNATAPAPDCLIDFDDDHGKLTMRCCEAAGIALRVRGNPAMWAKARGTVAEWQAAGVNVDRVAIPAIKAQRRAMTEPANSLAKFTAAVDTRKAKPRKRSERLPPAPPARFDFPDETQALAQFRRDLAQAIGTRSYADWCASIRFAIVEGGQGQVLQLQHRTEGNPLWQPGRVMEAHGSKLRSLAKQALGVTDAW